MYIRRNLRLRIIVGLAWRFLVPYLVYCALVVWCHESGKQYDIHIFIPFLPLSTIGIAVSFYLGFKNNQSYERLWEARKIWAHIVSTSRTWGNQVMNLVFDPDPEHPSSESIQAAQHKLILCQLAWINSLRVALRTESRFSPHHTKFIAPRLALENQSQQSIMQLYLTDEQAEVVNFAANVPSQLMRLQGEHLKQLLQSGLLSDFRHMQMMDTLEKCNDSQALCERIKSTPFPRQYAFYSQLFTWVFVLLLPFGLVSQFDTLEHNFSWLTVPFSGLIAWIFMSMEVIGDRSEDPFESFIHDVPMNSLCRSIEVDLLQMLGEQELPQNVQPVDDVLM